jgi:hypothetical protein
MSKKTITEIKSDLKEICGKDIIEEWSQRKLGRYWIRFASRSNDQTNKIAKGLQYQQEILHDSIEVFEIIPELLSVVAELQSQINTHQIELENLRREKVAIEATGRIQKGLLETVKRVTENGCDIDGFEIELEVKSRIQDKKQNKSHETVLDTCIRDKATKVTAGIEGIMKKVAGFVLEGDHTKNTLKESYAGLSEFISSKVERDHKASVRINFKGVRHSPHVQRVEHKK